MESRRNFCKELFEYIAIHRLNGERAGLVDNDLERNSEGGVAWPLRGPPGGVKRESRERIICLALEERGSFARGK